MKVEFGKCEDGAYECILESMQEAKLVKGFEIASGHCKEEEFEDPGQDLTENLCVGGQWLFDLNELHWFVQQGVVLHGLPKWLIIN